MLPEGSSPRATGPSFVKCPILCIKRDKDQFILDCPPEKLRRELEEELKMNGDEPRSHAWYHGAIPRQVAENLVQRDGDFLVRDSLSSPGSYVLTCQWRNAAQHFKVNKRVVMLNEAYSRVEYRLDKEGFDSVPALIRYYVGNRKPVSQVVGAIIFQPINRALPLRCLEEKYGLSSHHKEVGLTAQEKRNQKRLSLNITNGHPHDKHNMLIDRCGSQPASLNQILERRRPLKAHQSESFLPLGCKPVESPDTQPPSPNPKSPVFRTGSEPLLSPSVLRRATETGQAIRGSDSQLCPKPPPKPSKVLPSRFPRSPGLQPQPPPNCSSSQSESCNTGNSRTAPFTESLCLDTPSSTWRSAGKLRPKLAEEQEYENNSTYSFQRPVMETESAFQPNAFDTRLLPEMNKPLEMSVLKRSKELLLSHDHHSIARHLLMADCQVARILGVAAEMKSRMGVASGLELVTLPHGQQLRLDLMERHHTLAIGVAVDILGCTGSVEERTSTLNRIILVATELKDTVGDLFAFTALMKALDMPQITRLEETWTVLRRNFTQTAIGYEKVLKPFYKNLYEGSASSGSLICVPLLLPLLTLMERPPMGPEGAELWETSDHGCDIMLRHLEAAREMAQNSERYTANAHQILRGFEVDKDLLEVFKTDFQLRLLWGSRGAAVNQSDRYNKFNLILTALSRKLEPPPKTQTLI
uniref:BCAR3 adaptor protein, NSP family member n=1 Tax=Neogobius melanostomus TaxID=47308 RepID=A0A8C6T638_9GOBI